MHEFRGLLMKNPNVVIRAFDMAADLGKLSSIWFRASLIAHPFIGEQRLLEQQRLIKEKYLPNSDTWVACRSGEAVAFISLMDKFIGGLFVDPDEQGQGIGRRLIAHGLERKGELSLEVYVQNDKAFRFYKALGFVELSRRHHDDEGQPFENAYLLLKG